MFQHSRQYEGCMCRKVGYRRQLAPATPFRQHIQDIKLASWVTATVMNSRLIIQKVFCMQYMYLVHTCNTKCGRCRLHYELSLTLEFEISHY